MEFEKVRDIIVETLGCDAEEDAAKLKTVGDILILISNKTR